MTIRWKAVRQHFTVELFVFQFYPVYNLEHFSVLDLALSGVKGFKASLIFFSKFLKKMRYF